MPSWSIHLAIAKKVNQKLNLNKDLFYYGNLIPDVDKGSIINRYDAHFYGEVFYACSPHKSMINFNKFLNTYKNRLNNDLIKGYYSHILTDYFFNNIVYSKCWVHDKDFNVIGIKLKNNKIKPVDIEDKKQIKKKYKHADFELYGKHLFNDGMIELPTEKSIILDNINILKPNFLDENLVNNRFKYLENEFNKFNKLNIFEKIFKNNYKLFTKKELDIMFNDCVNFVIEKLDELQNKGTN